MGHPHDIRMIGAELYLIASALVDINANLTTLAMRLERAEYLAEMAFNDLALGMRLRDKIKEDGVLWDEEIGGE